MKIEGEIVALDEVTSQYHEAVRRLYEATRLFPVVERTSEELVSFSLKEALVTSHFVVIDTIKSRLFTGLSYTNLHQIQHVRYAVTDNSFAITCEPIRLDGQVVVLGGPIDGVWYHWLFNWLPRLLLLKELRPHLLLDPKVRFLVHPKAMQEPFSATLMSFGIAAERFIIADPGSDYLIEDAHLVSFCDQNKLYPSLVRGLAKHLLSTLSVKSSETKVPVFASRQSQPPARRRIHNFDQVEPVLLKHGFEIAALGTMSARIQAELFFNAKIVVGAHGSDLSNLLFCQPGTPVIVIESRASVHYGLHVGLEELAKVLDLDYRLFVSFTTHEPEAGLTFPIWSVRDYIPDAGLLDRVITAALRSFRFPVLLE